MPGNAVGRSGVEGIDGIIKEDGLGLDVIHLQAKRWERTIGRPDIQQFAGALQGQRARKGVSSLLHHSAAMHETTLAGSIPASSSWTAQSWLG
jgi:restriction endonuclease Mrr